MSKLLLVLTLLFTLIGAAQIDAQETAPIGVELPEGFSITQVASDSLATDIFSMTLSPLGEPVVSGPGYIKILFDIDKDGVYDSAKTPFKGPRSGAQGMLFSDQSLLYVGDGALRSFSGEAIENQMPMTTGAEHTGHALRRGPDGWLYVLAGNATKILPEYFNGPNSPVKNPEQGFLMRISPGGKTREIVAHGFRNAYDFDFNSDGQVFVYDSDGERQVSLPWYQGTRLFEIQPGDHAGFVTPNWKRPAHLIDMPKVIGDLGRGSPTGVECYRADKIRTDKLSEPAKQKPFPVTYRDAIFVCDWTFGRIVVFKRDAQGEYNTGTPFATSVGQQGFAVTDIVVTPSGSLLVSVGGRGTKGGVYRIDWKGKSADWKEEDQRPLKGILGNTWGELHQPLDEKMVRAMLDLSARDEPKNQKLAAIARLVGHDQAFEMIETDKQLLRQFNSAFGLMDPDPEIAHLWFNVAESMPESLLAKTGAIEEEIRPSRRNPSIPERDILPYDWFNVSATQLIRTKTSASGAGWVATLFTGPGRRRNKLSASKRLQFIRLCQLAFGKAGHSKGVPAMFHGYTARKPVTFAQDGRDWVTKGLVLWCEDAAADSDLAWELGRTAAMAKLDEPAFAKFLLGQISDSSSVVRDIHWLNCLSCLKVDSDRLNSNAEVAKHLVGLQPKLVRQQLNQDRDWRPRVRDLVQRFLRRRGMAEAIVLQPELLADGNEYLFPVLPAESLAMARQKLAQKISEMPIGKVNRSQIEILAGDLKTHGSLIRKLGEEKKLRSSVIQAISRRPVLADAELLLQGFRESDADTWKRSAEALWKLRSSENPTEVVLALRNAMRLGNDKRDVAVRDRLIRLIERRLEVDITGEFGYQYQQPGKSQVAAMSAIKSRLGTLYPEVCKTEFKAAVDVAGLSKTLDDVPWEQGQSKAGRVVFENLNCAQCHDGGQRLGPSLSGVNKRFARDDLFRAIVMPHEQVPMRYSAIIVETVDGKIYKGAVIYDSVDGVTMADSAGNTIRINKADIEGRRRSQQSIMPQGLLDDAAPKEWADLFAYLKTL